MTKNRWNYSPNCLIKYQFIMLFQNNFFEIYNHAPLSLNHKISVKKFSLGPSAEDERVQSFTCTFFNKPNIGKTMKLVQSWKVVTTWVYGRNTQLLLYPLPNVENTQVAYTQNKCWVIARLGILVMTTAIPN